MCKSPSEFRVLVIAKLEEVFSTGSPEEQIEFLLAAGECSDPDAVRPFALKALHDPDKRVRSAGRKLLHMHDPHA